MSHEGGSLEQMAKDGTSIPGDAGKLNTIPSVASAHQKAPTADGLGATDLHSAADNSMSTAGSAGVGEGITGTGDALPESTAAKPSGSGGKETGSHPSNRPEAVLASKANRAEREA